MSTDTTTTRTTTGGEDEQPRGPRYGSPYRSATARTPYAPRYDAQYDDDRYDDARYDTHEGGPAYAGPEYAGRQPAGSGHRPGPGATAGQKGGRGKTVAITVGSVLAAAGLTAGLVAGLGGLWSSTAAPTADPGTSIVNVVPGAHSGGHAIVPAGGGSNGNGGGGHVTPPTPPTPPVKPSQAVETLQQELGQLNYYEGPDTGIMNAQTTQAITYLQRDAHLPQTGTMNAATQAALTQMLATGNNHMGG
ncbi:peptidoglycan-binding domain-containing protein [Pseudonocardia oroxyli]|uniref:Putative peptidoglycan binding domain-containing protein n=1 Tax=Pseudonocardia oroxyli TaxID=366584 RepID=A0A1G7X4S0_PSEOR|nr:peptidoglycan-binding domain-containing protein [Pseudonocardia oroxyli]SDG79161.1 Putative peptidoglycan binding domain-containing protein [Pseudonocardia oroxyli]